MNQISAIALNTFREAIRNRVFASLVLFAIAMLMLTMAVSSASLNEEVRLMKDVGLFLVSTFSVLISVFIGVNLVYKEIERRTIYTVMPKPIYRFQFLLGKYFGLAGTVLCQVVLMGFVLAFLFFTVDGNFGMEMVQALWLIYIEVLVVMAIALVFSSFSTPFLSGLFTVGTFIVGRFAGELLTISLVEKDEMTPTLELATQAVRFVGRVAPDLSLFNTTPYVVYDTAIEWGYVGQSTLYGLTYVGIALLLAAGLFTRRDFV